MKHLDFEFLEENIIDVICSDFFNFLQTEESEGQTSAEVKMNIFTIFSMSDSVCVYSSSTYLMWLHVHCAAQFPNNENQSH